MTPPAKKEPCSISPKKMECDVIDSGDSNSTLTGEEIVLDEEVYSSYVGVKLIYFEHSYMKNYVALSEMHECTKSEEVKLPDAPEDVENADVPVPVRRSLRQMNMLEKDSIANPPDDSNSVHLSVTSNICTENNKERIESTDNDLNLTAVSKNKTNNVNKAANGDINDVEIHSENKSILQSPPRRNVKRIKLSEVKVVLEKDPAIDLLKTSENFITVENGECKKKDNLILTRPRRKRMNSEPTKSDLSSPDLKSKEIFKNKKVKVKPKGSSKVKAGEKLVESDGMQKKKQNLSVPSDKISKEEILKNFMKNIEVSYKERRKKCVSLSEDSTSNNLVKIENKKNSSPENKSLKDVSKLSSSSSNSPTKPKAKKHRKDSLRFAINDDEPALFSEPDVLVKVKTDDGTKKEEKTEFEDKVQLQINNLENVLPVVDSVSETDLSNTKIQDIEFQPTSERQEVASQPVSKIEEIVSQPVSKIQESATQPATALSELPLENSPSKANDFVSEYLSEKDDFKDIDSENSLQIDESIEKIYEEDNIKNSEKELSKDTSNMSIEKLETKKDTSIKDIKCNDDVKEELTVDEPKALITNMADLDCDKPIAERKPRRIIKKKEFFEDITARSTAQTKKSGVKQKGADKKATKEESKPVKKNSTSKAEVDSEDSSEDDPTKLWCICRQPHNDRFMIMCDRCEDWFHGNCVGITRQQGRKLEKLQKEWICPNCQKKGLEAAMNENSAENKVEPEKKKMKVDKVVPESKEHEKVASECKDREVKNIQPSTKDKIDEKHSKPDLKNIQDKQTQDKLLSSSNSSSTSTKNEKVSNQIPISKRSFNKNNLNTSKGTKSATNTKKGLKEPIRKKQNCISCQSLVSSINSCYCNDKCLEKHAADCLAIMREGKGALKGAEFDSQRIVVLDRVKGNVIAGDNAPTAGSIISWLKENPSYMIACSSSASSSSKNTSQKKETDSASSEKSEASSESKAKVRLNVRKTLKNILMDRCKFGGDIQMPEEDIRKIAVKIEEELHFLFKDNSFKYRAKYRSLMFNIKDPRNQGLFRKILKGNIPPDKLVRMSPEELASMELAKWREKENQHSLDMIKRVQLEQQNASGLLLKKTHKGEVEIEDDFSIIDDIPKALSKVLSDEPAEVEKPEPDKEIVKDSTHQHRSHLFDLNCKICTGKVLPPPVEDNTPKKVHVARSISIDLSSPATLDPIEKSVSRIVEGKSPSSSVGDDSLDQELPTGCPEMLKWTLDDIKDRVVSIWNGFIEMQDVTSFRASAFKVSGHMEYFDWEVPEIITVCGRIIPDQVWDYLGKIKQSGNKELIIIRFQPYPEDESVDYNDFYSYLSARKRYGVVSNCSKKIKDFYLLPLAATSPVPIVLLPFDGPGLPSPRPHMLLGVLVQHKAKQIAPTVFRKEKSKEEVDHLDGSYTPPLEARSYTPPLPALQNDSSVTMTSDAIYSPSMDLKSSVSLDESTTTQNSNACCEPIIKKTDSDIYEPSYTPPLQLLSDSPKEREDEKPYDPEQDILSIRDASNLTLSLGLDPKSSPKDEKTSENLEKHKKILDALTKQVEETDRQVNALKQLISQPDDSDVEYHSPSNPSDIINVAATGMSSFLDLPGNIRNILGLVKEKEIRDRKGDVDMRIMIAESLSNLNYHGKTESELKDKNSSCVATPPLENSSESSRNVVRPSDPRIKLRTSFQESLSEEPANVSLSNMSASELVERAEKQLAEIEATEKPQNVSPTQEKLSSAKIDTLPPTCWSEFKEPPPPGIELSDLASPNSAYSSKTISSTSDNPLPSSFSSPLVQEAQQITPHFPPPSIPPAFPPPLPPGFSIQTPPPNLKNFPPPNVIPPSFPPPPLPVVTKASDISPVSETWPSWRISSQQSKDSSWQNRVPQWDENWKNTTDTALVDRSKSSSHYYPPGTSEFHKESFYRDESSAESRWNRPSRYGRNNWHKHPSRGGRWRGRRGSFYFNKNQRN